MSRQNKQRNKQQLAASIKGKGTPTKKLTSSDKGKSQVGRTSCSTNIGGPILESSLILPDPRNTLAYTAKSTGKRSYKQKQSAV